MSTPSTYAEYKAHEKAIGNIGYKKIPCVNHPIFKGKPVNFDPRERFVSVNSLRVRVSAMYSSTSTASLSRRSSTPRSRARSTA